MSETKRRGMPMFFAVWLDALGLWFVSAHWHWWADPSPVGVTAGDVPGIRRAALALFVFGCIGCGAKVLAVVGAWLWRRSGLAEAWAEERQQKELRELARLKRKYGR